MKAYGGVDVCSHIFLTSALSGGEWSVSRPYRFTPGETAPRSHWIGGWVDPRAGLEDMERIQFDKSSENNTRTLVASYHIIVNNATA
jgi:hypothetical protein